MRPPYARPFAGFEYADRLALRFEGTVTGRFGEGGGTDAVLGATVGLRFFTR